MAGTEGQRPHFDRPPQQRTPTEQHKPQLEGGNGSPGIPPTLNERAKPPPEGSAYGGSESTSVQQPHRERRWGDLVTDPVQVQKRLDKLGKDFETLKNNGPVES